MSQLSLEYLSCPSPLIQALDLATTSLPSRVRLHDETAQIVHDIASRTETPLIRSLDDARVMRNDPQTDLTPDTLRTRNTETEQTSAARALAAASDKGDTQAMAQALKKLDQNGSPSTPQLEGLKQQARILTGQTGQQEPIEVSSTQAAVSSPPVDEVITETDGTTIQTDAFPQEFLQILEDFTPGLITPSGQSLEQLNATAKELDAMLDRLQDDERPVASLVMSRVLGTLVQVENRILSMTHLAERLEGIQSIEAQSDLTPAQKLAELQERFLPVWKLTQQQTKALDILQNGTPAEKAAVATVFQSGITMIGEEAESFALALTRAMSAQLKALCPENSGFSDEALSGLASLALEGGFDAAAMLENILAAPAWTSSQEHRSTLVSILAQGVRATLSPDVRPDNAQLTQRMGYVDMLFQGAYPEAADNALALKKLLLPGSHGLAEMQHQHMLTSRQLLSDILAPQAAPNGKSRTDSLARTASGSVSLRSFVLTPDIVKALTAKVDIDDFNFHLAHVALIQKQCADSGLLPVDSATRQAMSDMAGWCRELGLDSNAAEYAAELDSILQAGDEEAEAALRDMLEASSEFVRGLSGRTERNAAGKLILKTAKLSGGLRADQHETTLYESSPEYLARMALDKHIVSLSGLLDPNQRLAEGQDGMQLNQESVDAAMAVQTRKFLDEAANLSDQAGSLIKGGSLQELTDTLQARMLHLRVVAKELRKFHTNVQKMQQFGHSLREQVRLQGQQADASARFDDMTRTMKEIRFSWPHQHADRRRVSSTVLDIAAQMKELSALPENSPLREHYENRIASLLYDLRGVDVFRLVHDSKSDAVPDLETVLEHMLPRAQALEFFKTQINVNGLRLTEAQLTLAETRQLRHDIKKLNKDIDKQIKSFARRVGKENMQRMQDTVTAAVLKVFTESGQSIGAFNTHDSKTMQRITDQLNLWGMDTSSQFLNLLVRHGVNRLTLGTGRLDTAVLRKEIKDTELVFAGKESAAARTQEAREQGKSYLSARWATRSFVKYEILSDARRRHEGIHALMQGASTPGSGFVYDRTRGVVLNTGSVFSPIDMQGAPITKTSLKHPLSVRFQKMHSNSLTVSNIGNGAFQVMLKGTDIKALGAKLNMPLGTAPAKASIAAGAETSKEQGLALTFSNREDCEAFLNTFMQPHSHLHKDLDAGAASWRKATQIRFIDGRSVSANISVGLIATLFAQKIVEKATLSLSGTATLNFNGEVKRSMEQNAQGETVTLSRKGSITGTVALSPGLTLGTTLFVSPKLSKAKALNIEVDQRFKIVSGEKGIMPDTCVETECSRGALSASLFRKAVLPAEVARLIDSDPDFADDLNNLFKGLPPTARLVVQRDIKPEVLGKVRQLMVDARNGSKEEAETALDQAHDLLASFDSYTPARLVVKSSGQQALGLNWSPGLAAFQYARKATVTNFASGPALTIQLPQAEV